MSKQQRRMLEKLSSIEDLGQTDLVTALVLASLLRPCALVIVLFP